MIEKLNSSDLRVQFYSDVEDPGDHINCEVYLRDVPAVIMRIEPRSDAPRDFEVQIQLLDNTGKITAHIAYDDFLEALTRAKKMYVDRLLNGPNPFASADS